ncbi:MAG TPA: homoserine kinase [Nitriliruptoraceae bacterium]|nr:homoserine kinase [Nitriliruptoraceae bacterium]
MSVTVRVPATSANLGAGYDCLGIALARHVRVTAIPGSPTGGIRVRTTGHGARRVATGDDNLVWSALLEFCQHHEVAAPDVTLQVHNDIPLARGLGSSSSAIVAGLMVARALTDVEVGTAQLVELATRMEGHPDNVAPALMGGFVAGGVGTDGTTVVRHAQPTPALQPVVAIPAVEQLTSAARAMVPDRVDRADVITQVGRGAHVTGAVVGAWPLDVRLSGDVMHEPARLPHMEVTAAVLAAWRDAGVFSWLSGAGPTAAALVDANPAATAHAVDVATRTLADFAVALAGDDGAHEVVALDWDLGGAVVEST